MAEMETGKQREMDELREQISSLEKELDNANKLLSDTKHRGEQWWEWVSTGGAQ